MTLFDIPTTPHDPGGKVRLPMLSGIDGDARFSEDGQYRYWLSRYWAEPNAPFMLWVGMNPSTADALVDDPTIRKEIGFTRRAGYSRYIKCNVMDYRATHPDNLLTIDTPRSKFNLHTIRNFSRRAGVVVCCWGRLHPTLKPYAEETLDILRPCLIMCLGRNKDGSPKHPLYLPNRTPFERFP